MQMARGTGGVQPTSLAAYDSVALTERQQDVLDALFELGEASDQQIAERLGWTINRVTGRRGELVEAGLVMRGRIVDGPLRRKVSTWRPVPKQLRMELPVARARQ